MTQVNDTGTSETKRLGSEKRAYMRMRMKINPKDRNTALPSFECFLYIRRNALVVFFEPLSQLRWLEHRVLSPMGYF